MVICSVVWKALLLSDWQFTHVHLLVLPTRTDSVMQSILRALDFILTRYVIWIWSLFFELSSLIFNQFEFHYWPMIIIHISIIISINLPFSQSMSTTCQFKSRWMAEEKFAFYISPVFYSQANTKQSPLPTWKIASTAAHYRAHSHFSHYRN